MWKMYRTVLRALLLTSCTLAQAAVPVLLDAERDDFPLSGHLESLNDAGARMTLDQARVAPDWAGLSGMPNAGFSRAAIWIRLTVIQLKDGEGEWHLSIDDALLDEVQLHTLQSDGSRQVQRAGHAVPRAEWPLDSRIPAFRLRLPPGTHEIYLRLQSQHTLSHPIRLQTINGHIKKSGYEAFAFGSYFGIFAVAILLQLAFWIVGREAVSGWYLLFTSVILGVTVLRSGYPQLVLEMAGPWSMQLLIAISILGPMVVVRLSAVWLQLHQYLPRFNRFYQGSTYLAGLLATGLALTYNPAIGLQISQTVNIVMILVSLGLAVWLWYSRLGEAGYYLLVFGAIDMGILVRLLRNLSLLPVNLFTDYAIYIGTIFHLILMSVYSIQRHNKLRIALESERRAREEQKDFVGMVSHEFRTPLAIINTSIQQLSANLDAPAGKSLQRAQNIRDAVQRMDLLLDDYLSLDRMDSAQQALRLRPCDFYEVIEDAASDWPVEGIRIRLDQLPSPCICDPDLMRIVLRNLLANAVRHSPDGALVQLDVTGQAGGLCIRVQDQGEGIPEDELPHLFLRYFRGRASQGKPGAGLGLHLVQRIIQKHGGSIDVQSTFGQGSCFTIFLPPGQTLRS